MTVRISATDWREGGIGAEDAVEIARAFAEHGADGIDVSTGQVVSDERPAFGRSYQTPYADRIRNEIGRRHGIAVIAVGAISSWDDVNSIIAAGRADFCAVGRAHLYDPHWTLHAAAEQDYAGPGAGWPDPFKAGSRRPQTGRTDGPRPRLELVRSGPPTTAHARWRPAEPVGLGGQDVAGQRGPVSARSALSQPEGSGGGATPAGLDAPAASASLAAKPDGAGLAETGPEPRRDPGQAGAPPPAAGGAPRVRPARAGGSR